MKKRLKKKWAKAVEAAKDRLNGWSGEYPFAVIADGFFPGRGVTKTEAAAIRQVVASGWLQREWQGWTFALPKSRDVRRNAKPVISAWGKLYEGASCFEDCREAELEIDVARLRKDPEYFAEIHAHELGRAVLEELLAA